MKTKLLLLFILLLIFVGTCALIEFKQVIVKIMEDYFYIICLISFAIIFGIAFYLAKLIYKEIEHYRLFAEDSNMRKLLANDPKRFHISIVYLMTYMTRSNGDKVQKDKLEMIVRYIREVIPQKYHYEAIIALKNLTERGKGSGKHRRLESVIDAVAFFRGDSCIDSGDDSFHYIQDLHGMRMAAGLASYMTEDDRMYVMYLLYRLAIADGIITTGGRKSEVYMLNRLCVEGLKIDKRELDSLLNAFKNGNDQTWYDQHFCNKEYFYPSSDVLADIFRMDMSSLSLLDGEVPKEHSTSIGILFLPHIIFILSFFIMFYVFYRYENVLMGDVYSKWFFSVGFISAIVLMNVMVRMPHIDLESSFVPVQRTKIESGRQLIMIIISTVFSIVLVFSFLWEASNTLFLVGNETFCNTEPIVVTKPVTDTYTTTSLQSNRRKTTHYHVRFPEVSFRGKNIEVEGKKEVSIPNKLCLQMLPWLSCMKLKGVENARIMNSCKVGYSSYSQADGKDIELYYKMGYFGLLYYDGYKLIDRKEDVATESFDTADTIDEYELETVENWE